MKGQHGAVALLSRLAVGDSSCRARCCTNMWATDSQGQQAVHRRHEQDGGDPDGFALTQEVRTSELRVLDFFGDCGREFCVVELGAHLHNACRDVGLGSCCAGGRAVGEAVEVLNVACGDGYSKRNAVNRSAANHAKWSSRKSVRGWVVICDYLGLWHTDCDARPSNYAFKCAGSNGLHHRS